jgi:putative methionine-R-sulfoxide reductase with GAF domain
MIDCSRDIECIRTHHVSFLNRVSNALVKHRSVRHSLNGVGDGSDRLGARLALLRSVSHALARPLETVDILRAVHTELARLLDVTISFFGLYDRPGDTVNVIWQVHEGVELPGGHFPLGDGWTSQVIRSRQPRLIRHWSTDGPHVHVQYATDRPGLPESAITMPVVFDEQVIGVLSLQSYRPEAYDEDDVAMLQGVADQMAIAIATSTHPADGQTGGTSEVEAILASLPDALLVVDDQGRLVRVNQAARQLLCPPDGSLLLGHPLDRPQAGLWPLGTQALTRQLVLIVDRLRQGDAPREEIAIALDDRTVRCKASVLLNDGSPAGGVMVLREVARAEHP